MQVYPMLKFYGLARFDDHPAFTIVFCGAALAR